MNLVESALIHAWQMLVEAAPYIWLGLLAAGALHVWIPRDWVIRRLGGRGQASVWKAALVGAPLPLCSCGVIPAAVSLRKQGASRGATLSFLISTPETSLDSVAITYALLGPVWAIIRPIAAIFSAILTGSLANLFRDPTPVDRGAKGEPIKATPVRPETQAEKLRRARRFVTGDLLPDIGPWLLFGILASGVVMALLPERFLDAFPGGALSQMLIALAIGIPLYICASASTPLAAALLLKGLAPGAALVLLLAGPATNLASAFVISRQLGAVGTAVYFGGVALGSFLAGAVVQLLAPAWRLGDITLGPGWIPEWLAVGSAWVLLAAIILPFSLKKYRSMFAARSPEGSAAAK